MKKTLVGMLILILTISSIPVLAETHGIWTKGAYIDEFREPTGEYYVSGTTTGTFSNSVATDAELTVRLIVDVENLAFLLYKYGDVLAKGIYDVEEFTILMKGDETDEKFELSAIMVEGSDRLYLASTEDKGEFYRAFNLNQFGKMRFVIKSNKNPANEYFFVFDDIFGFNDACDDYLAYHGIKIAKDYGIEVGTNVIHKTLGAGTVVKVYSHFAKGNDSYCPIFDVQFADGTVSKSFVIPMVIDNGFIQIK